MGPVRLGSTPSSPTKNMLKEEITNPNTSTEIKRDHLKDLFEEIGLDVEKINPNIMRKLRLLNEKTETFKDEERSLQVARSLFEYYKNRLADIRFTDQEQRVILIGTMFADIGKTGPKDATPEQEEIILDIYGVENIPDPNSITLLEFVSKYFPADAEKRLSSIETINKVRSNMTMREFYNLHSEWTFQIISGDGVPPEAIAAAAAHHMIEGINPEEIVGKGGRFTRFFGENVFFDRAEKLVIILDKYDGFRRRGKKGHKEAIALIRKKIKENPNFLNDREFEELLSNLDAMISENEQT